MAEERDGTRKCLDICADVAAHIDNVRPSVIERSSTYPNSTRQRSSSAETTTTQTLDTCKESLIKTIARLQADLIDINDGLQQHHSSKAHMSHNQMAELERLQEERDSNRQMLAICAQALQQAEKTRVNYYEDITLNDDTHKVMVSTVGDLISAKRITAGARSTLWIGQMSDASLQQLSRDNARTSNGPSEMTTDEHLPREPVQNNQQFEGRYGTGRRLSRESSTGAGAEWQPGRRNSSDEGARPQLSREDLTSAGARRPS